MAQVVLVARAGALDEGDVLCLLAVRGAQELAAGRAVRIGQALELLEFAPNVRLHSIIAGPTPNALRGSDDNVVKYESAHLDEAESELVYQGTHTDQNSPPVVAELRRILREHLEDIPAPREGALPIP